MKAPARILLALDTGDCLADVWTEGLGLASTFGSELVLVHAVPEAGEWSPEFDVLSTRVVDLFGDLVHQAEERGVKVPEPFEVHSGVAADVILTAARERRCDLIVMGAAAKGAIDRILLGSTAEALMRKAPLPVWLVRPGRGHDSLKKILCAVDDSAAGRECLSTAVQLARTYTASLTLLHALPPGAKAGDVDTREIPKCMEAYDLHGIDVRTVCSEGSVAEAILVQASATGADLVVVGEAGRTGLARILDRNTAERVVRKVPCSLLAVKPS